MSRRPLRRALRSTIAAVAVCWLALALVTGGTARAHDQRPGVLSLLETEHGVYEFRLIAPVDSRGDSVDVVLALPTGCVRDGTRIRCTRDFIGTIAVRGMRGTSMRILVRLQRRDGARVEWIASANTPEIDIRSAPPRTWHLWLRIGFEHVVGGLDHVAFVIGLLLVLGLGRGPVVDRRLLAAITAFTVSHSLTLALALTGVVRLSVAPVEACIAASVLLVAREATHCAPTLTRRVPWLAAAGFGLIHGLGFASALADLGLPGASLASSLALFNLGIEAGQLAVVVALIVLAWLAERLTRGCTRYRAYIHGTACYVLGAVAAWWLTERVVAIAVRAP